MFGEGGGGGGGRGERGREGRVQGDKPGCGARGGVDGEH